MHKVKLNSSILEIFLKFTGVKGKGPDLKRLISYVKQQKWMLVDVQSDDENPALV